MSIACPHCAAQMPDTAAYCPGCGRSMGVPERAQGTVGGLLEPIAGALAYVTIIPAIVFLLLDPYKKNRFVRFHSLQCLLLWGAGVVVGVVLRLVGVVLLIIPVVGHLLILLIVLVVVIAGVAIWLVLVVKALQGEMFKLPLLGDFAERWARTV
ncbi:MAG: zinc-ribbon domain-containing protein [Candidatus Sulfotelmatobacter sp.]